MLPSLQLLEKVSKEIMSVPNRKKESKRRVHFCCFLLCSKAVLRVGEAVSFNLENKTKQGLYRIEKSKGKKERLVYIPKKVIKELKTNNWQPNQTNRWNFYHFLKKIKRELNINESVKLTPHTLRRAFTTYQAESGMPLPILQKLLGHSSIRTTALYWHDTYTDDDIRNILQGKKWLENKEKKPLKPPIMENFPEFPKTPKPVFIGKEPIISPKNPVKQDNSLSTQKVTQKGLEMLNKEISLKEPEKFLLNNTNKKSDQLKISQSLTIIANNEEKPTEKETVLLTKIKLLEEQLKQTTTERDNLKQLVQQEKQRANQAEQQLQKISQQLEQKRPKNQAQIIQPLPLKLGS